MFKRERTIMITRAVRRGAGLGSCLVLAAGLGTAWGQGQPTWNAPAATDPAPDARAVAYTFRLGELLDREANAAEHCRKLGSDAVLAGIDYPESGEGAYYKARFECGAPAPSGFLVTYRAGDLGRLRGEIEAYCSKHGGREAKFSEEPAVTVSVSKGRFQCE
jgi:hypothetical protein